MTSLTKEAYYRLRAESYPHDDPEALLRYRRALAWLNIKDGMRPWNVQRVQLKI